MLIDEFLPDWDVRTRHGTDVDAPPDRVFAAVRALDLRGSAVTRWLFRLRGLWAGDALTLEGLLRRGFVILGERPPEELLLGLVGRPWTPLGGVRRLDPERFRSFDEPGYARIAWNFTCAGRRRGRATRLETETRVRCTDDAGRRSFGWYWRVIGPFSAVVRRETLAAIRRGAEIPGSPAGRA